MLLTYFIVAEMCLQVDHIKLAASATCIWLKLHSTFACDITLSDYVNKGWNAVTSFSSLSSLETAQKLAAGPRQQHTLARNHIVQSINVRVITKEMGRVTLGRGVSLPTVVRSGKGAVPSPENLWYFRHGRRSHRSWGDMTPTFRGKWDRGT